MGNKVTRKIRCSCSGLSDSSGRYYIGSDNDGDTATMTRSPDRGRGHSYNRICECKGRGYLTGIFVMADEPCRSSGCFDGKNITEITETSTNWLGKVVFNTRKEKKDCDQCFGTGKAHYKA